MGRLILTTTNQHKATRPPKMSKTSAANIEAIIEDLATQFGFDPLDGKIHVINRLPKKLSETLMPIKAWKAYEHGKDLDTFGGRVGTDRNADGTTGELLESLRTKSLETLTVVWLQWLCEELGFTNWAGLRKAELIDFIILEDQKSVSASATVPPPAPAPAFVFNAPETIIDKDADDGEEEVKEHDDDHEEDDKELYELARTTYGSARFAKLPVENLTVEDLHEIMADASCGCDCLPRSAYGPRGGVRTMNKAELIVVMRAARDISQGIKKWEEKFGPV